MDEAEDKMSTEKLRKENNPPGKEKPKKRSLVERELETSLTPKLTSPLTNGVGTNTSRYGRARRLKADNDFCDTGKAVTTVLKSPQYETSSNSNIQNKSPAYKMQASNSRTHDNSPKRIMENNLDDQIESIYNANISLSRFGSAEKNTPYLSPIKKGSKVYIRTDLIQSKEKNDNVKLIKNIFSPARSAREPNNHLTNILERSSEKYNLNKPQNGYLDKSSVVKTLDFDCSKKNRKDSRESKCTLSKSELFELEAKCQYQVGDLAWARIGTFPFWPCIVTREPGSDMFVKKKLYGKMEHDLIHVTFFGDNGRRSWVLDSMLKSFQGLAEFEATREKFTPEAKKKDPRLHAAFFISDKKLALWHTAIEEAEILQREPKRLRVDLLYDMLGKPNYRNTPLNTPKVASSKITRTDSDVSLSESLFDTLFSEDNKVDEIGKKNPALDVSEVVTACLDNMAAKTGITMIQKQSHMDIWLQKAKSKTPEKSQLNITVTVERLDKDRKSRSKERDSSRTQSKESESNSSKKKKRYVLKEGPIQKPYSFRKSTESKNLRSYRNDPDYSRNNETCSTPQDDITSAVMDDETPICIIDSVESLCNLDSNIKETDDSSVKNQEVITDSFALNTPNVEKLHNTEIIDKPTDAMEIDDAEVIEKEQLKEGETGNAKGDIETIVIIAEDPSKEEVSNVFIKETYAQDRKESKVELIEQLLLPEAKSKHDLNEEGQNKTRNDESLVRNEIEMSDDENLTGKNNQKTVEEDSFKGNDCSIVIVSKDTPSEEVSNAFIKRTCTQDRQDSNVEPIEQVILSEAKTNHDLKDKAQSKTKNYEPLVQNEENMSVDDDLTVSENNQKAVEENSFKGKYCSIVVISDDQPTEKVSNEFIKEICTQNRNDSNVEPIKELLFPHPSFQNNTSALVDDNLTVSKKNHNSVAEVSLNEKERVKSINYEPLLKNDIKMILDDDLTECVSYQTEDNRIMSHKKDKIVKVFEPNHENELTKTENNENFKENNKNAEENKTNPNVSSVDHNMSVDDVDSCKRHHTVAECCINDLSNEDPSAKDSTKHLSPVEDRKNENMNSQREKDDSSAKDCNNQEMPSTSADIMTDTEETTTVIIIQDDVESVEENFTFKENEVILLSNNKDPSPDACQKNTSSVVHFSEENERENLNMISQYAKDDVDSESKICEDQKMPSISADIKTDTEEITTVIIIQENVESVEEKNNVDKNEEQNGDRLSKNKLSVIKDASFQNLQVKSSKPEKNKHKRRTSRKIKNEKVEYKPMKEPEFLNYIKMRQDAIMDENPKLTQEELVAYLYKTWQFEISKVKKPSGRKSKTPSPSEFLTELDDCKIVSESTLPVIPEVASKEEVSSPATKIKSSLKLRLRLRKSKSPSYFKKIEENHVSANEVVNEGSESSSKPNIIENVQNGSMQSKLSLELAVTPINKEEANISNSEPKCVLEKETNFQKLIDKIDLKVFVAETEDQIEPYSHLPEVDGFSFKTTTEVLQSNLERKYSSILKTSPEQIVVSEGISKIPAEPKPFFEQELSETPVSSNMDDVTEVDSTIVERKSSKICRQTKASPNPIVVLEGIPKITAETKFFLEKDQVDTSTCSEIDISNLERKSYRILSRQSKVSPEPIVVLEGIPKISAETKIVKDELSLKPLCSNIITTTMDKDIKDKEVDLTNLERKSSKRLGRQYKTFAHPIVVLEGMPKISAETKIALEEKQSQKLGCNNIGDITKDFQSNLKRKSAKSSQSKASPDPILDLEGTPKTISETSIVLETEQPQKPACSNFSIDIKGDCGTKKKSRRSSRQSKASPEPIVVLEGMPKISEELVMASEVEKPQKSACGNDKIEVVQTNSERKSRKLSRQSKAYPGTIVVQEGLFKNFTDPVFVLENEHPQKSAFSNIGNDIIEVVQPNLEIKSRKLSCPSMASSEGIGVLEGIPKFFPDAKLVLEDKQSQKLVCSNTDVDNKTNATAKNHIQSEADTPLDDHKDSFENMVSTRRSLRLRRSQSPSPIDTEKTPLDTENQYEVIKSKKDETENENLKETSKQAMVGASQNESSNINIFPVEWMDADEDAEIKSFDKNSLDNLSLASELTNGFIDHSSDKDFDPETVSLNSLSSETSDASEFLPENTKLESVPPRRRILQKFMESENESVSSLDDITLSDLKLKSNKDQTTQNLRQSTENSMDSMKSNKSERTLRLVLNNCLLEAKETKLPVIKEVSYKTDFEFEISQANSESSVSKKNNLHISSLNPQHQINGFHESKSLSPERTEVKIVEKEPDTLSITSSGSEASIKRKKRQEYKPMEEPEFLQYLEMRQDALIDEHPEVTPAEITAYLYKTWQYEESVKREIQKNEMESSNLVKGVNQSPEQPKKKKVLKQKKLIDIQKIISKSPENDIPLNGKDPELREMPKRKVSKAFYKEEFSDIEEEIELFEIFKNKSKQVKIEGAKEVTVSDTTNVKVEAEFKNTVVRTDQTEEIKTSQPKEEHVIDLDTLEYFDQEEAYFEQLTQPKPNIFKGLIREKVCEICEKTSNLVKCKGCCGMFHVECVNKEDKDVESPAPTRGRKKKKKPRGRKLKSAMDSNEGSHSDEKPQDLNVSEENMSIEDLQESQPIVIPDADTFETQLEAKMKEIIETENAIEYDSYSSDDGIDWADSVAGKCEIVDVKLKPRSQSNNVDYSDFKCKNCQKDDTPICFVCKSPVSPKNNIERRQKCQVAHCHKYYHLECLDHWPQTQFNAGEPSRNNKKIDEHFEAMTCPRHVCHTCVCDDPRGCKTRFCGDKLARCVRCPATYHSFTKCLPAGSQILSASHIVCPRHYEHRPGKIPYHVNTGWCFICALGGNLICCDYCPTSFHADCLNIEPPEGGYMCEDCETGRLPLYGEMVWVKLGHYRWWPGIVLHPSEIPDNIMAVKHSPGEFVVRFFGQYDHYWVNRGRVFPFQEGDSGRISTQKSKIDEAFTKAMEHAQRAFEIMKNVEPNDEESQDIQSSLLPPHYVKLKVNRPCGSLYGKKIDIEESSLTQCECNPDEEEPCGPYSHCLNRMLLTECGPICRAGERCQNRAFEKRQYPKLVPYRTPHRGWGLKTLEDIRAGQFVIEYVGELIDEAEFRRRMQRKHDTRDENFYFLTLDKERMIDAGPKGNLARFMNHCCEPNCETQKWTVLGDIRVGLFAIHDIPANTEVTFNYNLECTGIEKKQCMCGAKRCSGYMGAKPKQEDQPKKLKIAAKRTYKKRKNTTDSPTTNKSNEPKRPRGRPCKPRELTDIEKDLLIIKNATNGISSDSDCSTRPSTDDKDITAKALKRKRVSFSSEEVTNSCSSPSVKKMKLDDETEVGD